MKIEFGQPNENRLCANNFVKRIKFKFKYMFRNIRDASMLIENGRNNIEISIDSKLNLCLKKDNNNLIKR